MNVLIELGHPAHVYFFSSTIRRLNALGHRITLVTRNKALVNDLVKRLGEDAYCASTPAKSTLGLLKELLVRWFKIAYLIRKNNVQVTVSIAGISTSLPAKLCGIKSITYTDTEDASLSNAIAFAFSDVVYTPEFFLKKLGDNHKPFKGLKELAYLQNYNPKQGKEIRKQAGLPERYSLVRLVAYDALHDKSYSGIRPDQLDELLKKLSAYGKVFVSSQDPLPEKYAHYNIDFPIEQIHAVLEGAQLLVGESPTMSVEAGLLGTPSFLVCPRYPKLGNMIHLEKNHQLLRNFKGWDEFFEKFQLPESPDTLATQWKARASDFRAKMPDMNDFILNSIVQPTAS